MATRGNILDAIKKYYRDVDESIDHLAKDIIMDIAERRLPQDGRGSDRCRTPIQILLIHNRLENHSCCDRVPCV
ncbi:MAG: hypothetical protein HYY65_06725 [Candidatus Tectomicrobia bacterium]|uniref:Uncharacterized protein n=1 Tax=Tectimicrobiota bacterium TaxID=2528274 RepID=A0A932M1D9_UNCTE|nr:hypothetical protein [Candidatus Tectomicrobia bacterium]